MAWALRARAPPVAAGSLPRATRSAPKAGALCAPGRLHVLSAELRTLSPGGQWGCRRRRALRAAREARCKACFELLPRACEGGVAHREDLAATAFATLERSAGTVAHGRGRRASGVAAAPRSRAAGAPATRRRRAGHAPPARRGRRVRVPRAFKRPAKTFVWWWCGGGGTNSELYTSGWLPLIGGSILCTTSLQARSRDTVAVCSLLGREPFGHVPTQRLAGRENACSRGPARAVHALDGQRRNSGRPGPRGGRPIPTSSAGAGAGPPAPMR
jgi:hypothetical protein